MSSMAIALIVFLTVFGSTLLGMFLQKALPHHHLSSESRDAVKLGMGLVGTMTALILGLLTASAKNYFDTQSSEMTDMASKVIILDRNLAQYGPETEAIRSQLRAGIAQTIKSIWPPDHSSAIQQNPISGGELLFSKIQELSPKTEAQQSLKAQALNSVNSLMQERWLMLEQGTNSISIPLLVVLVFWLSLIFLSFGLFAPSNATVVATFFFSGLSVSASIFLILEMYQPLHGIIKLSPAPLQNALDFLGH